MQRSVVDSMVTDFFKKMAEGNVSSPNNDGCNRDDYNKGSTYQEPWELAPSLVKKVSHVD